MADALLDMSGVPPLVLRRGVEQVTVQRRRSRERGSESKTGAPARDGRRIWEHGLDAMFALALPPALTDVVVRAVARVLPPRLARALGAAESPTRSGGRARGHEGGRGAS